MLGLLNIPLRMWPATLIDTDNCVAKDCGHLLVGERSSELRGR